MFIHEAILESQKDKHKPYIRRKIWPYSKIPVEGSVNVKLYPTNGPDCCVILSSTKTKQAPRWEPTRNDLLADDWEACL